MTHLKKQASKATTENNCSWLLVVKDGTSDDTAMDVMDGGIAEDEYFREVQQRNDSSRRWSQPSGARGVLLAPKAETGPN